MRKEFEILFKEYENTIKKAEQGITKEYVDALKDMYDLTAEMFRKYEIDGKLTYEEMAKYKRMQVFYNELDQIVNELYKTNSKGIRDALSDTYKLGYNGAKEIIELTSEKKLIPILKEEPLKRAMYNDISGLKWTDRMGLHRDTAVLKIRETMTKGLIEGQTYKQMSDGLNKSLSGQVVNPMRIVRTEGHRVFQEAKVDSLNEASKKVKMTKEWITSRDERVRGQKPKDNANHVDMDGVIIPYEDDFVTPMGNKGFAPGMFGVPEEDINCRCDFIIDFVDDKDIDEPNFIRISNEDDENIDTVAAIREELDLVPEKHREIINGAAKEIAIVSEGNSRYDRKEGVVYILENPEQGEAIHELGHAIETELDLYHDDEFLKILNNELENINLSNLEEDYNYPNPIWKLTGVDKFISDYQSRLYDNDIDGNPRIDYANMTINTKVLGEYFSEGYREYIKNPDNLKYKDGSLYNFIKGRLG